MYDELHWRRPGKRGRRCESVSQSVEGIRAHTMMIVDLYKDRSTEIDIDIFVTTLHASIHTYIHTYINTYLTPLLRDDACLPRLRNLMIRSINSKSSSLAKSCVCMKRESHG